MLLRRVSNLHVLAPSAPTNPLFLYTHTHTHTTVHVTKETKTNKQHNRLETALVIFLHQHYFSVAALMKKEKKKSPAKQQVHYLVI